MSLVATLLGAAGRRGVRVGLVGGPRLRPGHLRGQHGRAHAGPRRPRRPAHPGRPHRRRLARRRGPLHGPRARPAARRLRPGPRRRGRRRRLLAVGLAVGKVAAMVALTLRAGQPAHPLAARAGRRDALARAVHADGARPGAGHRGRVGGAVRRLDGPRRLPRRDGRRPLGVQPPGGDRGAADARRLRRAVLRLGRHAVRPAVPARVARPGGADSGRRSCSASRWWPRPSSCCWAIRSAVALSVAVGHRADRRVLVHPRFDRRAAGPPRRPR